MDNTTQTPQWPDIANSDTFKKLPIDDQEAVRTRYYDKVVAPTKPADMNDQEYKKAFLQHSISVDGTAPHNKDQLERLDKHGLLDELGKTQLASQSTDAGQDIQSIGTGIGSGLEDITTGIGKLGLSAYNTITSGTQGSSAVGFIPPIGTEKTNPKAEEYYNELNSAAQMGQQRVENAPNPNLASNAQTVTGMLPYMLPGGEAAMAGDATTVATKGGIDLIKAGWGAGLKQAPQMAATAAITDNSGTDINSDISNRAMDAAVTGVLTPAAGAAGNAVLGTIGKTADVASLLSPETRRSQSLVKGFAGGNSPEQLAKLNTELEASKALDTATGIPTSMATVGSTENPEVNQNILNTLSKSSNEVKGNVINMDKQAEQKFQQSMQDVVSESEANKGKVSLDTLKNSYDETVKNTDGLLKTLQSAKNGDESARETINKLYPYITSPKPGQTAEQGSIDLAGRYQNLYESLIKGKNTAFANSTAAASSIPVNIETESPTTLSMVGRTNNAEDNKILSYAESVKIPVNTLQDLDHVASTIPKGRDPRYMDASADQRAEWDNTRDAIAKVRDETVSKLPVETQAKLNEGMEYYKTNILPQIQKQAVSTSTVSSLPISTLDNDVNSALKDTKSHSPTSYGNYIGDQQDLKTVSPSDFVKTYTPTTGIKGATNVKEMLSATNDPEVSTAFGNHIASDILEKSTNNGVFNSNKAEELLNSSNGHAGAIAVLNPEDAANVHKTVTEAIKSQKDIDKLIESSKDVLNTANTAPINDFFKKYTTNANSAVQDLLDNPEKLQNLLNYAEKQQVSPDSIRNMVINHLSIVSNAIDKKANPNASKMFTSKWIEEASTKGTDANKSLNILFPDGGDDLSNALNSLKKLQYNQEVPTTLTKGEKAEKIISSSVGGIVGSQGVRFIEISAGKKLVDYFRTKGYNEFASKMFTDKEFTQKAVQALQNKQYNTVSDLFASVSSRYAASLKGEKDEIPSSNSNIHSDVANVTGKRGTSTSK